MRPRWICFERGHCTSSADGRGGLGRLSYFGGDVIENALEFGDELPEALAGSDQESFLRQAVVPQLFGAGSAGLIRCQAIRLL
jgi:hypothetical protein